MNPRRVNPPHYFMASIVSMVALARMSDASVIAAPWHFAGVIPLTVGVVIAVVASRQFTAVGTNIVPLTRSSALVTAGAFSLTRNPMYLGMVLALVGTALLLNSPWPWLVPCLFAVVLYVRFIRHEEALMAATFGDAYLQYKRQVRRWI